MLLFKSTTCRDNECLDFNSSFVIVHSAQVRLTLPRLALLWQHFHEHMQCVIIGETQPDKLEEDIESHSIKLDENFVIQTLNTCENVRTALKGVLEFSR